MTTTLRVCVGDGCTRPATAPRGLCWSHYNGRRSEFHRPSAGRRFAALLSLDADGCWLWNGVKVTGGYGRFTANGGKFLAHRWVYQRVFGEIPAGLTLDHLCRNPTCVNPFHLEPVTQAENVRRGVRARRICTGTPRDSA